MVEGEWKVDQKTTEEAIAIIQLDSFFLILK